MSESSLASHSSLAQCCLSSLFSSSRFQPRCAQCSAAHHSTTDKERGGRKAQISREMCGDGRMWRCEVEEDRKGTEHRNKQVFWRGVAVAFS